MNTSWKDIWHAVDRGSDVREIYVPNYIFKNRSRGGYYYGYYTTKDGKQVQFSCKTKNRFEAERFYHRRMQEILAKKEESEKNIPFLSAFTADFLTFCENAQPVYSPATTAAFRNALKMLLKSAGDLSLDKYTVEACQKFIYTYQASVHTRRKLFAHLRSAFKLRRRVGTDTDQPLRKIQETSQYRVRIRYF